MREPLWKWIDDFYYASLWNNDQARQQLATQHYEAWKLLETQPQQALTMLANGIDMAHNLGEPWWAAFYEYWRTEAWVFYLRDLNQGLYYAVQNAVECRKTHFAAFPGKGRVYRVLVDAYMFRDPIGYEDKIRETIQHMQDDVPMDNDTAYLLQARRAQLDAVFGRIKDAIAKTHVYLDMSQHSSFRAMHAYEMLGFYAYLRGEYALAEEYAIEVEDNARRCARRSGFMASYLQRALLHQLKGDSNSAKSFYQKYHAVQSRVGMKRGTTSYDWLCEYHELGGDADTAWALREEQLADLVGKGYYYDECWCHLRRLQLLGRMGKPLTDEIQRTQQAISQLLKPDVFQAALERIQQGDYQKLALFPQN